MKVSIVGAGVAGLCTAVELAARGVRVKLFERAPCFGTQQCSWFAGGMLAPWCEGERAEPIITRMGEESLEWWLGNVPDVERMGTLVVAPARDTAELTCFAARSARHQWLDKKSLSALEPDIGERFDRALFFADEAHLDPRKTLHALSARLLAMGGEMHFGIDILPADLLADADHVIDCRGLAARDHLDALRGVKGEMLLLRSRDIMLRRPVRLLHPRLPVYIVPRADHVFMVGATMIESGENMQMSVRSMMELLSAAYSVHPAFGEAEIIESGVQWRPAFHDNLPRIVSSDRLISINGLYRHGFLVAPALARRVADHLLHGQFFPEIMHEHFPQRQRA